MKKLVNNNSGMTLVEVLVAVAIFALVTTGIIAAMASSARVTTNNEKTREAYESYVGAADVALGSGASDGAGYIVEDSSVSVDFQETGTKYAGSTAVEVQKITVEPPKNDDGTDKYPYYGGVGVVKVK
jgi:prepilin-type N-terminal cleavage/methylation domain-containing protein